jgi:beta-glucosidase
MPVPATALLIRPVLALLLLIAGLGAAEAPARSEAPGRTEASASTPVPREGAKHEAFLKRIQDGPIDLLFLGDSITAMWPFTNPNWKKFEKHQVANFGVPGDRTENLLWRIGNGELEGIKPKVVVLLIGTNNLSKPADQPEWIAKGIKTILDTVEAKLPEAKIVLMGIFPRGKTADDPMLAQVKAVNALIKDYAKPDKIEYIDLFDKFVDASGAVPAGIMPDGLHPNGKGFAIWYAGVSSTIARLMK